MRTGRKGDRGRRGRFGPVAGGLAVVVAVFAFAVPASAAPAGADLQLDLGVSTDLTQNFPMVPNGGTVTVTQLDFVAGWLVSLINIDSGSAKVRFELANGLHFGADGPDAGELCTATANIANCDVPQLSPNPTTSNWGIGWDVVADQPGSYLVRAEITAASTVDPVLTNNSASVTVVVRPSTGGGGTVTVSAGAARVSPAKPKAGGVVSATVRVTANGAPVRPTGLACKATIGSRKLTGTKKAALGSAKCTYRTPKSAKGKTLRGSISFTARGKKFTKRFSKKLG